MAKAYITFDYSKLEKLPGMLEQEYQKRIALFKDALEMTAKYAVSLYTDQAPEDTGQLKESIENTDITYRTAESFFLDIGTDMEADYWRFSEYGTIFQDPKPFISTNRRKINRYLKDVYREMLTKAGLGK